ncbi:MAG: glycosyltransferase family 4 protein [Acidobacteria bacterium]|nr:glycosyltransferase family 4 protein [Acidobacteriota bacterium]MDW7984951.1 glycosyltransferase family 1 protein [Acidobacteriota bacterium]
MSPPSPIWVEAYVLEGKPTGTGRFLGNVLRTWSRAVQGDSTAPAPRVRLVLRDQLATPWASLADVYPTYRIPTRRASFFLWQQGPVRRWLQSQADGVYLATNYTVPLNVSIPRAVVIHDASFFRYPEAFPWYKRGFQRRLVLRSIQESRLVFVPSEWTAREVERLGRIPADRVVVTYVGWDPRWLDPPGISRLDLFRSFQVDPDAFVFLTVGSLFQRRRPELLIRIWAEMGRRAWAERPVLVWIGENRSYPFVDYARIVRRQGLDRWVRFLGYQPEDVLHAFYRHADAVLYLSEYEGFGLPVLEGLAAGKPVVVSDIPVFRELYGDFVVRTPMNGEALLDTLWAVLQGHRPDRPEPLLQKYTWDRTARTIGDALQRLV